MPRRNDRPRLRHHLEDEIDRALERYFGAGREKERDAERRREQYRRGAEHFFEIGLRDGFGLPELKRLGIEELELIECDLDPSGMLVTLHVRLSPWHESQELARFEQVLTRTRGEIRRQLAGHLQRRRTPDLRWRVHPADREPEDPLDLDGEAAPEPDRESTPASNRRPRSGPRSAPALGSEGETTSDGDTTEEVDR